MGIATQFLGDESSINLLWWVVVLKYLEVFFYFLTFGFVLQDLAVEFNHNLLAGSGVPLSRLAGFAYHMLSPSYYYQAIICLQGVDFMVY